MRTTITARRPPPAAGERLRLEGATHGHRQAHGAHGEGRQAVSAFHSERNEVATVAQVAAVRQVALAEIADGWGALDWVATRVSDGANAALIGVALAEFAAHHDLSAPAMALRLAAIPARELRTGALRAWLGYGARVLPAVTRSHEVTP